MSDNKLRIYGIYGVRKFLLAFLSSPADVAAYTMSIGGVCRSTARCIVVSIVVRLLDTGLTFP